MKTSRRRWQIRFESIYLSRYGTCLVELGRFSEAEQPLLEAYRRLDKSGQQSSGAMREVITALAKMCVKTGRPEDAAKWRSQLAAPSGSGAGGSD